MLRRKGFGYIAAFAASSIIAVLTGGLAEAAIPDSERQVLVNLYNHTAGAGWTTSTNWNGAAGTECTWYGVTCVGDHVTAIGLNGNNLVGTLPSLSALTGLQRFAAANNQLSGSIPSLTGMTNLQEFVVNTNNLTGSIPSLSGLASLTEFNAYSNQLTGSIPALPGLANLVYFYVNNNQLTGTIPSLTGLTNLSEFYVHDNGLSGPIPSLSGLGSLAYFYAENNQLSGSIPALTGLANLQDFVVHHNALSGNVPALDTLANLVFIQVHNNQLTGPAPTPPTHAAHAGSSRLCPNYLTPATSPPSATDTYWNAATGTTPWSAQCTPAPVSSTSVPTLSQWALGLLAVLLVGVAAILRRRERA